MKIGLLSDPTNRRDSTSLEYLALLINLVSSIRILFGLLGITAERGSAAMHVAFIAVDWHMKPLILPFFIFQRKKAEDCGGRSFQDKEYGNLRELFEEEIWR